MIDIVIVHKKYRSICMISTKKKGNIYAVTGNVKEQTFKLYKRQWNYTETHLKADENQGV